MRAVLPYGCPKRPARSHTFAGWGAVVRRSWLLGLAWASLVGISTQVVAEPTSACKGKLYVAPNTTPQLVLLWAGQIADPMTECIRDEFDKVADKVYRVRLYLDSEGGSTPTTDRVIAMLGKIRKTHVLDTVVLHGRKCWSACVAVFLAGKNRSAALASTWLFHEIAWDQDKEGVTVDRKSTERFYGEYFLSAGVSAAWLKDLYGRIAESDYWQTGQSLWDDKSGIITHPLDNKVSRKIRRTRWRLDKPLDWND
jgi:hypothetical protein